MRVFSFISLIKFAVVAAFFLGGPEVRAEATASPTDAAPNLKVHIFNDKLTTGYEFVRGILITASNQFSCVLPAGFRTQVSDEKKELSLLSLDQLGKISVQIVETGGATVPELNNREMRAQALARQPGAKVVDEFVLTAAGKSGPAFELEWWTEAKTKMSMRMGFIPFAGGHLEVTVFAPSSKFRNFDGPLNQLLLSIRTSPVGSKLGMQMISSNL